MKKCISLIIFIILILTTIGTVKAVDEGTVSLNTAQTKLKKGQTFDVQVYAKYEDGINGLIATVDYNSDLVELTGTKIADGFANFGSGNEFNLIASTDATVKEINICTLTFKVKEDVGQAKKIDISIKDITLGTFTGEFAKSASTVSIPLETEEVPDTPDTPTEPDTPENKDTPTETETPTKKETPQDTKDNAASKQEDKTKTSDKIPNTGFVELALPIAILSIIIVVAGISYYKYKNI